MPREPLRQSYLFIPAEVFLRVLRELNVIGRIGIDEIVGLERQLFEIHTHKVPLREGGGVFCEIRFDS